MLQGIRDPNNEIEVMSYSKVHVRSQRFLEKESFKQDIESKPIYKEMTFMHMGPIIKEKCMHMWVKISLSYWLMGRSPWMEFLYLNLETRFIFKGDGML